MDVNKFLDIEADEDDEEDGLIDGEKKEGAYYDPKEL